VGNKDNNLRGQFLLAFFGFFASSLLMPSKLIYEDESFQIRGACFEVYREKGCGFTEPIYQECLAMEFELRQLPADAQARIELSYKGRRLQHTFTPDFICYGKIVVEIKAVSKLTDEHRSQIINYLNATDMKLGLLINFGAVGGVQIERFAH
jgi:GxxExxY protein